MHKNAGIGIKPSFELHHLLSQDMFADETVRPTITVIASLDGKVFLGCPKGAPQDWWVPLQSRIQRRDGTLAHSALRVIASTIHVPQPERAVRRMVPLHQFDNVVPEGRKDAGVTKRHFVVGLSLETGQFSMNRDELEKLVLVRNLGEFERYTAQVATARPVKHRGIRAALGRAHQRHLVHWSGAEKVLH